MDLAQINLLVEKNKNEYYFTEDEIEFLPCVPMGAKVICVGLNYLRHAQESNLPVPKYPVLFNKFSNALSGHKHSVPLSQFAEQYDYEAELAIVIGKKTKQVTKSEALNAILGYCNANDLSARDLQMRNSQWLTGKTLDGFCPIGPYIVTRDEISDPDQLQIRSYVNGGLRQDSNTSDMIFKVEELISYISKYITLLPGDVILTGTPEGVILGYPENSRAWLKPGDEVTIEIEKLGSLTSFLVSA